MGSQWQLVLRANSLPPLFMGPISTKENAQRVAEIQLALCAHGTTAEVAPYTGPEPDMINVGPVEPK